ncbi:MAG: XrtA/PEP-CTERM system-associated ATPase [Pseudomonadota bacterium]
MYDQYYGFTGRPFQLTPDPQFYFESTTHKKALSYLGYGLNQAEGFIVITGEVGAGKSTLVAHLMERIDPAALTVAQVVTSALDGEELIHVVAQAFGLSVEGHDKAGALGAIEAFLQDEARAGRRCLLVVDECQNLEFNALEELRMLSNFQLGSHPLLQSLLSGQPEFRRTLANHRDLDQLRQRIIASHHLEALCEDEVEAYVHHRLKRVGWDGRPLFADGLLSALYGATDGIPRRVNQVMNRLLLLGAIEEQDQIGSVMLDAVMAEMAADQANGASEGIASPEPEPQAGAAHAEPYPAQHDDRESVPATEVAALLAERDARTAKLEAAIGELQSVSAAVLPVGQDMSAEYDALMARFENRLEEQERSFRHVMTMLIEWLEDDKEREAA